MSRETELQGDELSFSEAMEELERILRGVEAEETDIDVLGEELKRAAELLELCRTKIRRAEVEVTQIVQSLEDGSGQAENAGDGPDTGDENGSDELPF